jgi:LPXTG-motif cell wall-anchored protein
VIAVNGGDYNGALIFIQVDEDNVSLGMTINPHTAHTNTFVALGVNTHNELGIVDPDNPAKILTSGDMYDDVMDVYNDVVVDVFHMDYFKIGNYVRDSYFENLVSPATIIATVDIAPFTAYVTVPDNIVVDPPKTGDAASILGFVMLALSAAGAAALRKRG